MVTEIIAGVGVIIIGSVISFNAWLARQAFEGGKCQARLEQSVKDLASKVDNLISRFDNHLT